MDDDEFWDAVLDEELDKLQLGEDTPAENLSHFFPTKKDCECCKGYTEKCDCVSSSKSTQCMKCSTPTNLEGSESSGAPEYDTSEDRSQFSRVLQASAAAVESQAAPSLSRTPSVTSSESVFKFSVKIFPPPSRQLSRDMFKMMFLPAITAALGNGAHGENLTWPDRGWRSQEEYSTEMDAALQKRTCNVEGIVVARMQTEREASDLAESLTKLDVRACVVDSPSPPLISSSIPPPNRVAVNDTAITVPSHTTIPNLEPSYSPQHKRHHVVLYLPEEAGQWGSHECSTFVDTWYDSTTLGHFTRILGSEDPERGSSSRFTWNDRGWLSVEQFEKHTKESLKQHGHCVFARKINYRDAVVVHERLKRAKFVSSVIMSLSLSPDADPAPVWRCSGGHEMSTATAPPRSLASGRRCDGCNDALTQGELGLRCEPCDYDLCCTCVNEVSSTPCRVLFGRSAGERMEYPPSAAGNAIAPRHIGGAVGAGVGELLAQLAGGGGGGGAEGLMNALGQMLQGGGQNTKPGTKQSFIDGLVHKTVGVDNFDDCKTDSCVICMSEFLDGETVTSLPCGHWFHSGKMKGPNEGKEVTNSEGAMSRPSHDWAHAKESRHFCGRYVGQSGYEKACGSCDGTCGPTAGCQCKACYALDEDTGDSAECQGILPWLKKNNECPMCRCELEAETASDPLGLSGPWTCPGCRREVSSYSCDMCGIRRNIIGAANVTAAPLFDMVDSLFFALLSYHNRVARGDGSASPAELEVFSTSIQALLDSREMQAVLTANWAIRDAVAHLLQSAYHGERSFSFESSWMDAGSQALYAMLVDRLTAKLDQMDSADGRLWTIERPVIASRGPAQPWDCPLCEKTHDPSVQTCECGVDQKVVRLAEEETGETSSCFEDAERLAFRSLDVSTGGLTGEARQAALSAVRKDTAKFLSSSCVQGLEGKGWKLRSQLASFLNSIQNGKKDIPFEREFVDTNSIGLFACFVRRFVTRISDRLTERPEYASVHIGLPRREELETEMNFEDLTTQQYFVHPNTEGFLRHNKKTLLLIARLIAEGSGPQSWEAITSVVLPQFNRSGWMVSNAVSLMRRGMRDLQTLAGDLDAGSQSVIEAILRKVLVLEQAATDTQPDLEDMPPVPVMTRQVSVGTESKNVMEDLRARLSEDEFKKVILFLVKTLKHISKDQANLNYRRLMKSAPIMTELILPNQEAMSVLSAVGFVDEGNVLFLRAVNRDSVLRALDVLSNLARDAGIDIL